MDLAQPHDLGKMVTGIRSLTKDQADAVRDRIRKDRWWYKRLCIRMAQWHFRDAETQKAIEACCNVEHALYVLDWAMSRAGSGGPDAEVLAEDWLGEGI